ncbi:MAG TPA: DUF1003 domain-containing protein [Tepidisphaeraceae bacterium]|nr:DUF1003 domain-containing protein [Tepidisphaeraceae bacterium]
MARYRLPEHVRKRMIQAQLKRTGSPRLARVVERNINTLVEIREHMDRRKSAQDHIADWITWFSGSMIFVYIHAIWFGIWIAINLHWTRFKPFDPYPFGLLTMIVSLEAIFLATFVLISQNRISEIADQRADLDLQINLLAEYEITRVLTLVDAIADHLGLEVGNDPEVDELKAETAPEMVINEMEQMKHKARDGPRKPAAQK